MNLPVRRYVFIVAFMIVAVVTGSVFLIPVSSSDSQAFAKQLRLALGLAMALSTCLAGVLFFKNASEFRAGLRRAYAKLAVGLITFGVALIQWPLTVFFNVAGGFWATSGLIILPFIVATTFMYAGMRSFGLLLGVKTLLERWWVAFPSVLGFALLSGLASRLLSLHPTSSLDYDTYTATVAWTLGFGFLAWLLVLKTRNIIGKRYQNFMGWLAVALGALVFSGGHEYILSYFTDEAYWYVNTGLSLWPFIVAGMLFLYAGSLFHDNKVVRAAYEGLSLDRQIIDSITTTASLASRPADIDETLDILREVTAHLWYTRELTQKQHDKLISVYLNLERYLVSHDPLSVYSKDDLRQVIAPTFRKMIEKASHKS